MNVFLIENNSKFRESLKLFIEEHLHHRVVGVVSDVNEIESNFDTTTNTSIDVYLVDLKRIVLNNFNTINIIKNRNTSQSLNCIALSQYSELADTYTLLNAGFKGFVSKENIFRDLETAISAVVSGNLFYPKGNKN